MARKYQKVDDVKKKILIYLGQKLHIKLDLLENGLQLMGRLNQEQVIGKNKHQLENLTLKKVLPKQIKL